MGWRCTLVGLQTNENDQYIKAILLFTHTSWHYFGRIHTNQLSWLKFAKTLAADNDLVGGYFSSALDENKIQLSHTLVITS